MVPLVLLPFACLVFITTATCMYEMVHWDVPLKQRLNLMALYGPYTALRKFWFLLGAFHLLGWDEANWFTKPGFSGPICSSASKAWSKALPQYLGLRGRKTSEIFYAFSIRLVKRGPVREFHASRDSRPEMCCFLSAPTCPSPFWLLIRFDILVEGVQGSVLNWFGWKECSHWCLL